LFGTSKDHQTSNHPQCRWETTGCQEMS
jgi:hypothetical protein